MRHATYIHPALNATDVIPADNVRVSSRSRFFDDEWDLTSEQGDPSLSIHHKVIRWKFDISDTRTSFSPEYAEMLLGLRQLAYLMLHKLERKPISVTARVSRWVAFIRFLADRPFPVFCLKDVLESDMRAYKAHLEAREGRGANKTLSPSSIAHHLSCLNLLYDYKEHLVDHLTFRPTGSESPNKVAGFRTSDALANRTKAIPDDELYRLIEQALFYVNERAPMIVECLVKLVAFAQNIEGRVVDLRISQLKAHSFFKNRTSPNCMAELIDELIRLRAACFIVIAFSTGMRVSEIMSIKRGCIREEESKNHGTFYWIDSRLYKTQRLPAGSARSWMCGVHAANAVAVLEKISRPLIKDKDNHLFFTLTPEGTRSLLLKRSVYRVVSRAALGQSLKKFCSDAAIATHLHPHRLRRSFARNIIRWSATPIVVLKDHLKHWSLYMTDWYVGLDPELIEDLEAERLILSIESMEKICVQNVGGMGGRRWVRELEERMRDGRLPREFRGKAGAEFRKEMIDSMHNGGLIVTPCGEATYCVFQKDRALCTDGDYPMANRCNPVDCTNSFILPENVPFYKRKLSELEWLQGKLSKPEREGPVGLHYAKEISKIRLILEPFL